MCTHHHYYYYYFCGWIRQKKNPQNGSFSFSQMISVADVILLKRLLEFHQQHLLVDEKISHVKQWGSMFYEMWSFQWQPDDFLINFFFLAEGEEIEQVLVADQYGHKAAVAGLRDNLRVFLKPYLQLNKYWYIFRGMEKSLMVIMYTTLQVLYILDIIFRPCPICTFNCSTDSKLGLILSVTRSCWLWLESVPSLLYILLVLPYTYLYETI